MNPESIIQMIESIRETTKTGAYDFVWKVIISVAIFLPIVWLAIKFRQIGTTWPGVILLAILVGIIIYIFYGPK